ncbi:MAG: YbaB/EbfC family nucleoid-associated protein [Anaerolineaceae bacterium]|nr:YbaB/EbfC family nucleoid-associated protein [Anaerolineaceae bacterium]
MAKGYNKPKGLKRGGMNQANMMNQLQNMQAAMDEIQEQLKNELVSASVGGGVVSVTMNGQQEVRNVEIAPEILEDADVEMLQDLLVTAFNSALEKSRALQEERMGAVTGGLQGMMGGLGL